MQVSWGPVAFFTAMVKDRSASQRVLYIIIQEHAPNRPIFRQE